MNTTPIFAALVEELFGESTANSPVRSNTTDVSASAEDASAQAGAAQDISAEPAAD